MMMAADQVTMERQGPAWTPRLRFIVRNFSSWLPAILTSEQVKRLRNLHLGQRAFGWPNVETLSGGRTLMGVG